MNYSKALYESMLKDYAQAAVDMESLGKSAVWYLQVEFNNTSSLWATLATYLLQILI